MARCTRKYVLEVHHKNRNGGNDLGNAEVLCEPCHEATSSYGTLGTSPPAFSQETKEAALQRAGWQCECTRSGGCHQQESEYFYLVIHESYFVLLENGKTKIAVG